MVSTKPPGRKGQKDMLQQLPLSALSGAGEQAFFILVNGRCSLV